MTRNVARLSTLLALCTLSVSALVMAQTHPVPGATAPSHVANAQPQDESPRLILYEGNRLEQDEVCTINLDVPSTQTIKFQSDNYSCENDEARSIRFDWIPAGTVIALYDDPQCRENDDWVIYTFHRRIPYAWSSSFQFSDEDYDGGDGHLVYSKVYHEKGKSSGRPLGNALDGKVSCMTIKVPPPHSLAE